MKAFMQDHWEKLVLGVTGVLLVAYLALGMVLKKEEPLVGEVQQGSVAVNKLLTDNSPPSLAAPVYSDRAKAPWETVKKAEASTPWLAYKPTVLTPMWQSDPIVESTVLYAPRLDEPVVELGKVFLKWVKDPRTTATIAAYRVMRKSDKDAKFTELQKLAGDATSYEDGNVEPKTKYTYRVVCEAKDKEVDVKGSESEAKTANAMAVVDVRFTGVATFTEADPDAEIEGTMRTVEMANISVRRYVNSQWVEKGYRVRVGEKIGKSDQVMVGGKPMKVDFSTGFELVGIADGKVKKIKMVSKKIVNPETGVTENKLVPEEYESTSKYIKYKDEAGKLSEKYQDEAPAPPVKPDKPDKPGDNKKPGEK
jgi:hypothetical protein